MPEQQRQKKQNHTPLYGLHIAHHANMVGFAGYLMPLHYEGGILKEHEAVRKRAGLFDVSHMGQAMIVGAGAVREAEQLFPVDIGGLAEGEMRYSVMLNERGGIIDDLMLTRSGEGVRIVVNAGRKEVDFAHIRGHLSGAHLEESDNALLALQGGAAVDVLAKYSPQIGELAFMRERCCIHEGVGLRVSRSGYTGEDGFEVSLGAEYAAGFAEKLLGDERVSLAGLGARDVLRLEAGLCLYGHDMDEGMSPFEVGLGWTIAKSRREKGGFVGDLVLSAPPPEKKRVGLIIQGAGLAREGAVIKNGEGEVLGQVTSGGFSPVLKKGIAMGIILSKVESGEVFISIRNKKTPALITRLPFVNHQYYKGGKK